MSDCLSELSPQAPGNLDPFIPRHNVQDHHSDRTEESGCRNWWIMKHNEAAIKIIIRRQVRLCGKRELLQNLSGTLQCTPLKVQYFLARVRLRC